MSTPTKNEELKGQSHLVRVVIATLEIRLPSDKEIQFRATLLRKSAAEIATLPPQFLVRLFEAAAGADFPDPDIVEFRHLLELQLARYFDLAAFKAAPAPNGRK
jgi:hypothetical protein